MCKLAISIKVQNILGLDPALPLLKIIPEQRDGPKNICCSSKKRMTEKCQKLLRSNLCINSKCLINVNVWGKSMWQTKKKINKSFLQPFILCFVYLFPCLGLVIKSWILSIYSNLLLCLSIMFHNFATRVLHILKINFMSKCFMILIHVWKSPFKNSVLYFVFSDIQKYFKNWSYILCHTEFSLCFSEVTGLLLWIY